MPIQRRRFIQGCCAGIAAMAGARVHNLAFGAPGGSSGDILINVFLRGGMDALNFLVPHSDSDYHVARPVLGLDTGQVLDIDGQFGLHPSAAGIMEIADAGHMGAVLACGNPNPSRSHFEAQDNMDRGNGDAETVSFGGWLARHLAGNPSASIFQGLSYGSSVAVSLEGFGKALALRGADGFTLRGNSSQADDLRRALRAMWSADPQFAEVGLATLDAVDIVDRADPDDYSPLNGAVYPNNEIGDALASVAQMIRLDLGLQAATVDYGGWDTHESQASGSNPTTGTFADLVAGLSDALRAFWTDLQDFHGRLTVVVMSEFGRRLRENNNRGTDHGRAGVMAVISADLARGGIFGTWPGLGNDQLIERVDLAVTTDYRTVLTEVLLARGGHSSETIAQIFPGFVFSDPVGLFGLTGGFASSSQIRMHLLGTAMQQNTMDANGDGILDAADLISARGQGRTPAF